MTIARALLLIVVAGLVWIYLVWIYVDQALLVYPTPETESAFLKTYTPNPTFGTILFLKDDLLFGYFEYHSVD